jgi:tight adherence protein C
VIPVLLASVWSLVVAVGAARLRPPPARIRTFARPGRERRHESDSSGGPRRPVTQRLGASILRRVRRDGTGPLGDGDALTARRIGAAIIAATVVVPLFPPAAIPAAVLGWIAPSMRAARAEKRRLAAIAADLPDTVDLLVLGVGAGLTVHLALVAVGRRASGPLAAELRRVTEEVALGRRLGDALDDVPTRAGEAVRPLVTALTAADRYGAPLGTSLERLAGEVRRDRRRQAEEAARRVPVKLLFPLVTCTLPAFALLTVAPLIAGAIRSLHI